MKYCIGCQFLRYNLPETGYSTEYNSDIGKEDAAMACQKGYWRHDFGFFANIETFRLAMEKAETCGDYQERTSP